MATQNNTNPFAAFDEERKNRYMQMTGQSAPTLQVPKAEDAYREAFPQRETRMAVPQMEAPEKNYKYEDVRNEDYSFSTPKSFDPEEYKDGTADGLARNYFSKTFKPKTEEDYSRDNETTKRILALGDALRHIGNIVSTTNGAPAQKFNDPVALKEQQYQTERAHRETQAYKQAQQEYQRERLRGEQDMRDFKKKMGIGEMARKAANDKFNQDRATKNDQFNQNLATQKFDETKGYHQSSLDLQKARLGETKRHNSTMESISQYNATHKGSGGGSGHDKPIIPTKDGYMSRRTVLNSQDLQSLWRDMDEMKLLTPAKKEEYQRAYVSGGSAANNVIRGAIAWASLHVPKFREHLRKHYGFSEVTTTSQANQTNRSNQTSQANQANQASQTNQSNQSNRSNQASQAATPSKPAAKPTQPARKTNAQTTVKVTKKEEKKKKKSQDDINRLLTVKK